jgi:hypothetical protein
VESNEKANGLLKQCFPSVTGLIRNPTLRECPLLARSGGHRRSGYKFADKFPAIGLKIPVPEIISLLAEQGIAR